MKTNRKILCLLLIIISCGTDTFNKSYKLGGLRVLAITAGKQGTTAQAEFAPGDTAVVTAYVSDVGSAETVTAVIESCTDYFGIDAGATPSCASSPDRITSYANITLDTATVTGKTGAMPSFTVTIPSTILTGQSTADQFNGINYLVTMSFSVPSGKSLQAFKRLRATSRTSKNQNPTIGSIYYEGSDFNSNPDKGNFSVSSYSRAETYEFQAQDGSISTSTESPDLSWYVSDGDVDSAVTSPEGTTQFKPAENKASQLVVVAVLRDGRGGIAVQTKVVP